MVMMGVVSLFTKKPTAQQIDAITFDGNYKALIKNSWDKWDVIASLGVVILCAAFYWYFW
jgi:SSS family solute:Na+ symporter